MGPGRSGLGVRLPAYAIVANIFRNIRVYTLWLRTSRKVNGHMRVRPASPGPDMKENTMYSDLHGAKTKAEIVRTVTAVLQLVLTIAMLVILISVHFL